MAKLVERLWQGQLPLGEAVWLYAVGYGLVVNFITSLLFVLALENGAGPVLLVLVYALPLPYNLLVVVAVWRSADRYSGPRQRAELARFGTVLWMLVLSMS